MAEQTFQQDTGLLFSQMYLSCDNDSPSPQRHQAWKLFLDVIYCPLPALF